MSGLKLPPGPPRRPLIGNLLDMPKTEEWKTYNRWAKEYGDLVYVSTLGTSILFVNSHEMVQELFEKRGNIYSNRYKSTVVNELLDLEWIFTFQQPDERWRRYRASFSRFFNQTAIQHYQDLQGKYIRALLHRLHQSPDDLREHIRFTIGSLILEVTYGIKPRSKDDSFLVLSDNTLTKIGQACVPGTYLADYFPVLKYVPSWFPGANFKITLEQLRQETFEMVNSPIEVIKELKGEAPPSVASSLIEQFAPDNGTRSSENEDIIKHVPGTAYLAGIDTTDSTILQFFLAMALNPQVQKKAQIELDAVIGDGGLPAFQDRQNLPYIEAVLKEVSRWNPVVTIGVPHVLRADDIIGEYFIPKGTIVVGNSWTLLRNTSIYGEDADKFRPERFLQTDREVSVPSNDYAFGYGRRVCPGRHFAESTLFLLFASVLHVYNIFPDESEYPQEQFESGLVSRPKPFKCRIVPRSSKALKLLEELEIPDPRID